MNIYYISCMYIYIYCVYIYVHRMYVCVYIYIMAKILELIDQGSNHPNS